jgi:hypothetical protein
MADWTNIPNGNIETGKPIRAIDGRALRDNPIAIAEGAVDAPRVAPRALQAPGILSGAINGTSWVAFTGLGDFKQIRFDIAWANTAGSPTTRIEFSNDGGSSWGGTQILVNSSLNSLGVVASGHIDLETGETVCAALNIGASTTGNGSLSATLTVPVDCDAVRFSTSAATPAGRVFITPIGGRA